MTPSHILGMAPQGSLYLRRYRLYQQGIRQEPLLSDYRKLSHDDARALLDHLPARTRDRPLSGDN